MSKIVNIFKQKNVNVLKLEMVENFVFCLRGSNVSIKRVFSLIQPTELAFEIIWI